LLHQVGDLFELNVKLRCQMLRLTENWMGLWNFGGFLWHGKSWQWYLCKSLQHWWN
jgi:hypothetical protein